MLPLKSLLAEEDYLSNMQRGFILLIMIGEKNVLIPQRELLLQLFAVTAVRKGWRERVVRL